MGNLNTTRCKLTAAVLTAGITVTTNVSAEVDGLGLIPGDLWQEGIQLLLSNSESTSKTVQRESLIEPFLIPKAKSHGLTTFRDQPVKFQLQAKHVDINGVPDENLSWSVVGGPKHGTLSGVAPNLSYTPKQNFTGYDRVVFDVQDRDGNATRGIIDIKVNGSYTLFESGQVRPIVMNSRGDRLYALNTPDGKLEIFDVSGETAKHITSVKVGLEPVAISLRNDNEAWVVNTLSDNVSVVDLSLSTPVVVRTLHVGDEPQDIVFAGAGNSRAFITTARRGQHSPSGLKPMTPSVGRADVWVFNTTTPSDKPEHIVNLYGMAPRGLAKSPDGSKVYVAIYKSGNKTTIGAHNYQLFADTSTYTGKPGPTTDVNGIEAPNTGVIVKHDGEHWRDLYGTDWDEQIYFDLPDYDVFVLDANNPRSGPVDKYTGVGNALFNLAVNPANGNIYVSNMDARNELKFEGHGDRSDVQTLRGRFIKNQITVISSDGTVTPLDLNPHLDDSRPEGSASDNAKSLSMPLQMALDSTGKNVYVTAYGSSKVGVYATEDLDRGQMRASTQIEVSGGGPAGVVLDENRDRLYVLTRFNNAIAIVDTKQNREISSVSMYNPEPDFIVKGRPFLYDARFSSGRGDSSCGSCHLFGDMDGLAWELGNPDIATTENPRPYTNDLISRPALRVHHPLKGPMLTQSLRGLEFQGPQHWRGDRTGKVQVNGESLEKAAFKEFRGAFTELLGRATEPTEAELDLFADFVLQMRYPPNPNRNLDDTLTAKAQRGANVYFNKKTTGFSSVDDRAKITCNECHEVNADIERFGTDTFMSFEGAENEQDQKVPHLRNVYTRIGMFGQVLRSDDNTSTGKHMGDQVTGYGLSHDGAVDTMETFLTVRIFHVEDADVSDVFEFVTQVPTGLAPIVGQQATLTAGNQTQSQMVDVMQTEALAHIYGTATKPKCDLVAWGTVNGQSNSWMMTGLNRFKSDKGETISGNSLRAETRQNGNAVTFMCAPPGSGHRIALDRDEDGAINGVDLVVQGKRPTSITPVNPNAQTKYLTMEPVEGSAFDRERTQKEMGIFPDFNGFIFGGTMGSEELREPPAYVDSEYFGNTTASGDLNEGGTFGPVTNNTPASNNAPAFNNTPVSNNNIVTTNLPVDSNDTTVIDNTPEPVSNVFNTEAQSSEDNATVSSSGFIAGGGSSSIWGLLLMFTVYVKRTALRRKFAVRTKPCD